MNDFPFKKIDIGNWMEPDPVSSRLAKGKDEDGWICVFEDPPYPTWPGRWAAPELFTQMDIINQGTPNPHWRHSLDCLGEDDETI